MTWIGCFARRCKGYRFARLCKGYRFARLCKGVYARLCKGCQVCPTVQGRLRRKLKEIIKKEFGKTIIHVNNV
jgi:hypothetical protein